MKAKYRVLLIVLSFLFVLSGVVGGSMCLLRDLNINDGGVSSESDFDTDPGYPAGGPGVPESNGNYTDFSKHYSDLRNWTIYSGASAFKSINYDSAKNESDVVVSTDSGWEVLMIQFTVTKNTNYTLSLDFDMPTFTSLSGYDGLGLMVLYSTPTGDCASVMFDRYQMRSEKSGTAVIPFNSGNYTKIYVVLNFGYIADGQNNLHYKLSNFYLDLPLNNDYWINAGNYNTTPWSGEGTEANPYLIQSARDLARLSYLVYNSLTNDSKPIPESNFSTTANCVYSGKYFRQTCDIDLSEHYWQPIGLWYDRTDVIIDNIFAGVYDGNGYTVDGIFTPSGTGNPYSRQGLFGVICGYSSDKYGVVKNLTIGANSHIKGSYNVGGIVGCLWVRSKVENCINNAKVTGKSSTGGITGTALTMTIITNCQNYGQITATSTIFVGGIVGECNSQQFSTFKICNIVEKCNNYGNVVNSGSDGYTGGIAGFVYYVNIDHCKNYASVTSNKGFCGGIVGRGDEDNINNITNCINYGAVTSTDTGVGGIVGFFTGSVKWCKNTGTINGNLGVGGIVGGQHRGSVHSCCNYGNVTGSEQEVGGICGWAKCLVSDCYNTGNITSNYASTNTSGAAGIVSSFTTGATLYNCYNTGTISSPRGSWAGGIIGKFGDNSTAGDYFCNVANFGTVSSSDSRVAGAIAGALNTNNCDHCGYLSGSCSRVYGSISGSLSISAGLVDVNHQKYELWYRNSDVWNGSYLWDFDTIWVMDNSDTYPVLRFEYDLEYDLNGGELDIDISDPCESAEGYRDNNEYTFTGTEYLALGRNYMYTDKIYISFEAFMDDWNDLAKSDRRLLSCAENGGWCIYTGNVDNSIIFSIYDSGAGYKITKSKIEVKNLHRGWHKIECSFDGEYGKLYIDGSLEGTTAKITYGRLSYHSSNGIFVGAEAGANTTTPYGNYFKGTIKNIKILHTCKVDNITSGSAIVLPTPTREGYTFGGWVETADLLGDGTKFVNVFYHNNLGYQIAFKNVEEVYAVNEMFKFSMLRNMDLLVNNGYDLYLEYEEAPGYNYWHQDLNPLDDYIPMGTGDEVATGYSPISISWDTCFWGGLTLTLPKGDPFGATYLNGSVGHDWWFFAIGAFQWYGVGIPACGPTIVDSTAQPVSIWLRADNWDNLTRPVGLQGGDTFYMKNRDTTLTALWIPNSYIVSFNSNGGTGTMENQNMTYESNANLSTCAFQKDGYSFAGWAESQADADAGIIAYHDGESVKNLATSLYQSKILYTVWSANLYTVRFSANDVIGTMADQTFTYDVKQNLTRNNFVKEGYKFAGWATSQDNADNEIVAYFDNQLVDNLTTTKNGIVTLYAVWKLDYIARYDSDMYWYIEIGMMPQTRVSMSTNLILNNALRDNSELLALSGNLYKISSDIELNGYYYAGSEYCVYNNQWYIVEPIRWRLAGEYHVGDIITSGVNAILDTIVYIDAYSSGTTEYSVGAVDVFSYNLGSNGRNMSNLMVFTPTDLAGREDKIYIASEAEIQAIAGSYDVKFSDLVCDIVGTRYYYTRTPTNDGNMRVYSYLGFASAAYPTYQYGIQFVVKVAEFVCI